MSAHPPDPVSALLADGMRLLEAGDAHGAADCCRRALQRDPGRAAAHFLVGLVANALGDTKSAVHGFGSAASLDRSHAAARAHLARTLLRIGAPARAERALADAQALAPQDPLVQDLIGLCHSLLGDQARAKDWYERAVHQSPDHAPFVVNLASALMFLGENDRAEDLLIRLLKKTPDEAQGQWLLSSLRKADERARADDLMARAARLKDAGRAADRQAIAFFAYAAGKEYEDLALWDAAFPAFATGAAARRASLDYDEGAEQAYFGALTDQFDRHWLSAHAARAAPDNQRPMPVFIIGQPRTGTTLIDRIISAHPLVESAGELQQFGLSIRRLAGAAAGPRFSPDEVKRSAALDMGALGREYLRATTPLWQRAAADQPLRFFVDKLPGNYRFVPLILAALPDARIIHVTRHPADACFSSFKQLFADAYAHSYDLAEMARHFVRYHRLMEHWRTEYPGRFLDMSYEGAVSDTEPAAVALIDHLGLDFDPACLDFHNSRAAVATASAVQVREKPHTRSVGRWKAYRAHVAPMLQVLEEAGLITPND